MGDFQIWRLGKDEAAEEEDVNIQGAFPPAAFLFSIPTESGFDTVNNIQQFPGLTPVMAPQGGIEKPVLIHDIEGGSFKKRSDPYFPQNFPQSIQGAHQDPAGISPVRA
jgi:hypothetical protein